MRGSDGGKKKNENTRKIHGDGVQKFAARVRRTEKGNVAAAAAAVRI